MSIKGLLFHLKKFGITLENFDAPVKEKPKSQKLKEPTKIIEKTETK